MGSAHKHKEEPTTPAGSDVSTPGSLRQGITRLLDDENPSRLAADRLFKFYDRNGDRVLDRAESQHMLLDYGLDETKAAIVHDLMDDDGDGLVTFDEFWRWLQSGTKLAFEDSSKCRPPTSPSAATATHTLSVLALRSRHGGTQAHRGARRVRRARRSLLAHRRTTGARSRARTPL